MIKRFVINRRSVSSVIGIQNFNVILFTEKIMY